MNDTCKFCDELDCYEHCSEAPDGKHQVDPTSALSADDSDILSEYGLLVDYRCKLCGGSGSVRVDPKDIQWG